MLGTDRTSYFCILTEVGCSSVEQPNGTSIREGCGVQSGTVHPKLPRFRNLTTTLTDIRRSYEDDTDELDS